MQSLRVPPVGMDRITSRRCVTSIATLGLNEPSLSGYHIEVRTRHIVDPDAGLARRVLRRYLALGLREENA